MKFYKDDNKHIFFSYDEIIENNNIDINNNKHIIILILRNGNRINGHFNNDNIFIPTSVCKQEFELINEDDIEYYIIKK